MATLKINIEDDKLLDGDDMSCVFKLINEQLAYSGLAEGKRRALRRLGSKLWCLDNALTMAKDRLASQSIPVCRPIGLLDPTRVDIKADGTVVIKGPMR